MAPGDAARLYHRLTSYAPEREWTVPIDDPRALQDFAPNDLRTWPAPCKAYPPALPVVALPRTWPAVAAPATAVLAGRQAPAPHVLDLSALARLLHLSAGVVRVAERRAAATAMPSSTPAWSRAACTWPRMRSGSAPRG